MNTSKRIAIVTGASSGLGQEYIRQLDCRNSSSPADSINHYDEFWVIARRREKLEELAAKTNVPVRILDLDLTDLESIRAVRALLLNETPEVGLLINAAGFGKIGRTCDLSLEELNGMIDLNCRAAVDMTQIVIPFMKRGGRIMEICSTAAFSPIPFLNVYAASKAFLYRYSRALSRELWPDGIFVTAVCPYWIKDTEFISRAQSGNNNDYIASFPFAETSPAIVSRSLEDCAMGLMVSTPGILCTVHRVLGKILSSGIFIAFWELIRRIPDFGHHNFAGLRGHDSIINNNHGCGNSASGKDSTVISGRKYYDI